MKRGLIENHLRKKKLEKKKSPNLKAQVQLNEAITLVDIGHQTDDEVVVVNDYDDDDDDYVDDDDDADNHDDNEDNDEDGDLSNRRSRYIGHLVPAQLKVLQIRPQAPL